MKKQILFGFLMVIFAILIYAASTEFISPDDPTYWILNGTVNHNLTFIVNMTPTLTNRTNNCTFYTNDTGVWHANYLNNTQGALGGETMYSFTPAKANITQTRDDKIFIWNAYCCSDNNSNCAWAGNNRTVYQDSAPMVFVNSPVGGYSGSTVTINLTVIGDESLYNCYIFSNDTGTFSQDGAFSVFSNNTPSTTSRVFTEGNVTWNAKCFEQSSKYPYVWGWAAKNYSVTSDDTAPTITLSNYPDGAISRIANITLTAVDTNDVSTCVLYLNGTRNITKTSITSGVLFNLTMTAPASTSNADYKWYVACNDSAGNLAVTANRTITIDTVYPYLVKNYNYTSNTCNGFTLELNFSESANYSIYYGLSTLSSTWTINSSTRAKNQSAEITFGSSYEQKFYINVTACDQVNCNNTIGALVIQTPVGLCEGWSLWSVWDRQINLSTLRSQTDADYVYWWNNSGQSWLYYSTDYTPYNGTVIGVTAVQLYVSDSKTWKRNSTGGTHTTAYNVNLTGGHNYFGLYHNYTFGNLTYLTFRNSTYGNATPQGKQFQIDYIGSYNNSNQEWVFSIYTWKYNNQTLLGRRNNWLDALWVYSDYNITLNMTAAGHGFVYGNWT